MATKDLHESPFDEITLAKLQIFEDYAEAWIPTFIMSGHPEICIFDLFAGTGYDKNGVPGSPIRLLQKIKKFIGYVFQKKTVVKVFLNEYKSDKFSQLQSACSKYLEENTDVARAIKIEYSNEDFDVCFQRLYSQIAKFPSLVYLDQNGIKFLNEKYLLALEKTTRTDFLYFVSSSYFLRFGNTEEFKAHFNFDLEKAKKDPYSFIHRNLISQLREQLPQGSKLKLYPFTLRKAPNIHGIIFGAKNSLAVEKFLDIAWKANPINGDANFDIDDDLKKGQINLFGEKSLTKIEDFQNSLEILLAEKKEIKNSDVFLFTLDRGHSKKHANEHLKKLKKEKKIDFEGRSPKINYDSLNGKNELVTIKWIK